MNYLHKFGFHVFQRRESSFSSSNERRSLLPAIKPTDTMVHCTPSNKNQSASFRILFFFWNFKFFFFFCIFPTSPRTIFIQWIKNRGNFSKFLRFVFACVSRIQIYSSLVFRIPWMRRDYQPNCIWNFMEIYFFEKSYGAKYDRFISSQINAILRRYFQFFLSKSIVPLLSFNYLDARYVNSIFTRRETKCNQVEVFIITYSYTASNWKTY